MIEFGWSAYDKLRTCVTYHLDGLRGQTNQNPVDTISPRPELSKEEKVQKVEPWIKAGLELIKQGKFEEASDYYENDDMLDDMDFLYAGVYMGPVIRVEDGPEQIQQYVDFALGSFTISLHNKYNPIGPEDVWAGIPEDPESPGFWPTIQLSRLDSWDRGVKLPIPDWASHQIALAHAEIWVNILQMVKGGPLTADTNDSILDAQLYLMNNGVVIPPTYSSYRNKGFQYLGGQAARDFLNQQENKD